MRGVFKGEGNFEGYQIVIEPIPPVKTKISRVIGWWVTPPGSIATNITCKYPVQKRVCMGCETKCAWEVNLGRMGGNTGDWLWFYCLECLKQQNFERMVANVKRNYPGIKIKFHENVNFEE